MRIQGTTFSDTPAPKLKRLTPDLVKALEELQKYIEVHGTGPFTLDQLANDVNEEWLQMKRGRL